MCQKILVKLPISNVIKMHSVVLELLHQHGDTNGHIFATFNREHIKIHKAEGTILQHDDHVLFSESEI
jgi:hypothetical protein